MKEDRKRRETKKVVLFIVEGKTDKAALGLIMTRLLKDEIVRFSVVNGDFTIQGDISAKNAVGKMAKYVNEFLMKSHYLRTDISRIIHVIDTDGAFVGAEKVRYADGCTTRYLEDMIETAYVEQTVDRIKRKRLVSAVLAQTEKIGTIPYQIYYLSRNLEHVMYGENRSIDSRRKSELAEETEDKYADKPQRFVDFIRNSEFAVEGEYSATWDYIMEDTNSLKRKSNLHLAFTQN